MLIQCWLMFKCQLPWLTFLVLDVQAFPVDAADYTAVSHVKSMEFVAIRTELLPC